MNTETTQVPKEFQLQPLTCDEYLVNGKKKNGKGQLLKSIPLSVPMVIPHFWARYQTWRPTPL